jgi:hypothetical protein
MTPSSRTGADLGFDSVHPAGIRWGVSMIETGDPGGKGKGVALAVAESLRHGTGTAPSHRAPPVDLRSRSGRRRRRQRRGPG